MGHLGVSVLEVPDGDYQLLARMRPIVVTRRRLFVAKGPELSLQDFLCSPPWTARTGPWSCQPRPLSSSGVCDTSFMGRYRIQPGQEQADPYDGAVTVEHHPYDLWYDATAVGSDLVAACWISHGPRAVDPSFDPQPGDHVLVGDDEEPPLRARVIRRQGNRVDVQIDLADTSHAVA